MEEYIWSKHIRGLEGFNGVALFHHFITSKIFIAPIQLFSYIEDKDTFSLPPYIKKELIDCKFIIKDEVEDINIRDQYIDQKVKQALSGSLVNYFKFKNKPNTEILKKLYSDMVDLGITSNVFIVMNFYDSLIEDIEEFVGKMNFIVNIDLWEESLNIEDFVRKCYYRNIGIGFNVKNITNKLIGFLNKININKYAYVINYSFSSINLIKQHKEFLLNFKINLKYIGGNLNQEALIDLYNYVKALRKENHYLNVNWDIPLKRIENSLIDNYGKYAVVNIGKDQNLRSVINSREYIDLIHDRFFEKKECDNCGIQSICLGAFLNEDIEKRNELCFLSKYSIAEYINNKF